MPRANPIETRPSSDNQSEPGATMPPTPPREPASQSGRGGISRRGSSRGGRGGTSRGGTSRTSARGGAAAVRGGRGGIKKGNRGGDANPNSVNPAHVVKALSHNSSSPGPDTPSTSTPGPSAEKKPRKKRMTAPVVTPAQPFKVSAGDADQARISTAGDLSLFETGDFADASVVCREFSWKVHKTILCPRSNWFQQAFANQGDGGFPVANLHNFDPGDVDVMLRYIYSGSLEMTSRDFSINAGSFVTYANLFELGTSFVLPNLRLDALTLLGQFCDKKLQSLCSYDVAKSGRDGVLSAAVNLDEWIADLETAILMAFTGDTAWANADIQTMLATFCFAGRTRLFAHKTFQKLSETCPAFGNAVFKLMLPSAATNSFATAPVRDVATGMDHTHRSQAPDRCAHCHKTFGDDRGKAMFNPFEASVRPSAFCEPCVEKNEDSVVPLWRMPPKRGGIQQLA